MRAQPGAISRVSVAEGKLHIGTIGGKPAVGICGTGLLDAIAALRRLEIVDEYGGIAGMDELAERVHEEDGAPAVWLNPPEEGREGVRLTQKDVREFQLAKGAIAAGVSVLLRVAGIRPEEIDRVLLAGGFGSYLDPLSAIRVGLLPRGTDASRTIAVGNASLAGSRLALLSREERGAARELAARVEYVELSGRADFQEAFAEEMLFPEM
jgi:uncharacterized 2Fe-2S/4Fe-4S cluster protein (DUF4445 family)